MNNLDVYKADVSTSFLYGKIREKIFRIVGKEFGKNEGKRMLLDKGLYGLSSSAAKFHDKLDLTLRSMGFVPSKVHYDLWMRRNGDHYEYIATCVDALLVFNKKPMDIIETKRKYYKLKGVGTPKYYLVSAYLTTSNGREINN